MMVSQDNWLLYHACQMQILLLICRIKGLQLSLTSNQGHHKFPKLSELFTVFMLKTKKIVNFKRSKISSQNIMFAMDIEIGLGVFVYVPVQWALVWDCVILWMINFRSQRQCSLRFQMPATAWNEHTYTMYTATEHHMHHFNADCMRCVRFRLALVFVSALLSLSFALCLTHAANVPLLFSFTSTRCGNCWLLNLIMHSLFKIVRLLSCSISFGYCCRCCFVWWSFVFLQVHTKSRTNMK